MHSHSFQDQELKFHRNVEDSTRKVVYGLMILPYFRRGQTWRVNHSENLNSTCIRTVLKMLKLHSYVSHFPGQVVERLTILPYLRRGQKWRVNHSKNVNVTCIRTVFKMKSLNFTGMSTTPRDRSWKGWRFYRFPTGVRNKRVNHSKNVNSTCIAQFSRWRVETSQERRRLLETSCGRVDLSTVPLEGGR